MVNPPKAKMRCQRKSGFQESRRERVAQINETVEVGLEEFPIAAKITPFVHYYGLAAVSTA